MFQFDKNLVAWDSKIGQGPSSTVYPYKQDSTEDKWVIKCISKENFNEYSQLIQKVALGLNLDHPNILPVQGFDAQEKEDPKGYEVYVKLERMKKSLAQIISEYPTSKESVPQKQVVQWFYELVSGLEYLHNKRIAHMNINPSNILLNQEDNVKLADIGLVKRDSGANGESEETVSNYWAPELIGKENKAFKEGDLYINDIWSLGRSIMKLCLPEISENRGKLLSQEEIESEIKANLAEIETKYGKELESLLAGMLKYNPQERSKINQIKKSLEDNYSDILVSLIYKI